VAVLSSAFVLGWQSSRLPTDYVSMANVSCRAGGHDHVRGTHKGHHCQEGIRTWPGGTHKGHHCQEGIRTWPGGNARLRAGLTVLLDPSSQLPGPAAVRPGVKLERPQPRSGEDERA
jgi:hypothetical protein